MKKTIITAFAALLLLGTQALAGDKGLLGAGATFPYPLYSKMFDAYHKEKGVRVNYQSIGSGGGVRQIISETVDFGASDAFLNDKKLAKTPRPLLHVPIVLGSVAITYNQPRIADLKLDAATLSGIFLGKIKKWNDAALVALNPGKKLPDQKIVVVRRSDGSGTTAIFTDYLSSVSDEWKTKVGKGKSVSWPTGLGAKGNEGVAGQVKLLPGSIGYVELAYSIQNKMPQVLLKNKKGNFVRPSLESTSQAANAPVPDDTRVSLVNSDSDQGYPIAGFTWILIYQQQDYRDRSQAKAQTLVDLVWWMIHDGQRFAAPLHYAPLPKEAVVKAETILKSIRFGSSKLK